MKTTEKKLLAASQKVLALAEKRRARMASRATSAVKAPVAASAKPAAKPVAAAKVKAEVPNGGFQATDLKQTSEPALGEKDWGLSIPPEVAAVVEQGKAEGDDATYSPGIMIPPGLEDAVMAVADPETLNDAAGVRFDLIPFGPEKAQTADDVIKAGAHWVLCANGEPLAKISLKDQQHKEKIAAHFVSADFARSIVDGIAKHGLGETLKAVNAKPYVAVVDKKKVVSEIKAKLAASSEEALRQKTTGIKKKFVDNLSLVLEASANNFIVENPLKDSLVASLTGMGVPENTAAQLVDEAFFAHGQKTFASILDKAEEWSNTPVEAMAAIKAAMQQAGRRSRPLPSAMGPAFTNPNYDTNLAQRMAASAVPVVQPVVIENPVSASNRIDTQAPVDADDKSAFRARFGGFRA